jgi:hypothetical protein
MPTTEIGPTLSFGGIVLGSQFCWPRFAAIDNFIAIKVLPSNRRHTLEGVRGVVAARAE